MFQWSTKERLDWDDKLPSDMYTKWCSWLQDLSNIKHIHIPRCIKPSNFSNGIIEIHVFCDASAHSFASCCYVRCVNLYDIYTNLIYAKHRLAPVKAMTTPRLELQAAVLAAKMANTLKHELSIEVSGTYYWTDSTIVLCYIRNKSKRFKPFVANRLQIIHELTDVNNWSHVAGKENPADIASRGSTPNHTRWVQNNIQTKTLLKHFFPNNTKKGHLLSGDQVFLECNKCLYYSSS